TMERHLDLQLEKLKKRLIKMCSLVDEQVNNAILSVEEEDEELAKEVIAKDDKVDKFDLKIEKSCQKIFALNQPVAMDLRLIMSAMSLDTNLERIGDNAVNIAEHFLMLKKKPAFFNETKFDEMAKLSKSMLKNSIDAFINGDAELAKNVIQSDDIMDRLNVENHQTLINIMKKNCDCVEPGVAMISISKQMERVGDLATNIAEDVYFIYEAQLIKHKYEKYLFLTDDADEATEE
ncbi:MAG: phosphate signaling complex protein PhoU, partial [Ignavibacteria bacterium]|nr:phosphate signaling complex protein PhoU [Ignavibacteria bacterium]